MDLAALPPTMDCAPEFCFCGRKTIESHDFWYCSTECARQDSLRSLDSPECHYRNVVQAYIRAGTQGIQPRRTVSADHLRSFANVSSPFIPPTNPPLQADVPFPPRVVHDRNMVGLPTLSQVTSKILSKKAIAGESLTTERHDRPKWDGFPNPSSRARPTPRPGDEQISLYAIPIPEHIPPRTLRHVPSSIDNLRNNTRKPSVATLLSLSQSRKAKNGENSERIFGHFVNPIVPPVRKESLPSHRQVNPFSAVPLQTTKALRRSVSFNGWHGTSRGARSPRNEQDSVMHIIEEMREELSESFDPKSLFNQEEDY